VYFCATIFANEFFADIWILLLD